MPSEHAHQLDVSDAAATSSMALDLIRSIATWPDHVASGADAIPEGRQLLSVQRALSNHGLRLPIVEYHMRRLDGDAEFELLNKTSAWVLCLPDGRQADAWGETCVAKILSSARSRAQWPDSSFAVMSNPTDATKLCERIPGIMREQAIELDAYLARQALFLVLDRTTAQAQGQPRSPRL